MAILEKIIISATALLLALPVALLSEEDQQATVYIIPIHEMIEPALTYVLTRQIEEGRSAGADAFVFTMNTPGGAVGAAEDIIELISSIEVPTYTFVERNAISAGALISLATDEIYMASGSKIGDAMPYQSSPLGGAAKTPERMNEKIESYVAGLARTTAQSKGHNPDVATAMVRPDYELKIDGNVISPSGQLLTLTNLEAEKKYGKDQKPLLSSGTVADENELLQKLGFQSARIVRGETTLMERLGRLIPPIGPLLLMAGLLGVYIEIRTPGLGLPGLLGGVCLVIFFWGHHIAGLAGLEDVVVFGLGVVLLMLEVFVIPGFGIAGILGILLMLTGVFMAMVGHIPTAPSLPVMPSLALPIRNMAITIIGTALGAILLGKFLPKSILFKRLTLEDSTSHNAGYSSSKDWGKYVGQTGVATSALRPSGTARFEDERLDVIAEGEFISNGTKIRVVAVNGNHVYVEPA